MVPKEQAGLASGVTLTIVVGLAGLGVAVSASVLDELEQHGTSASNAVKIVLLAAGGLAIASALVLPLLGQLGGNPREPKSSLRRALLTDV